MPDAFYIILAFGLTYVVLVAYAVRLAGLTKRARAAIPAAPGKGGAP
jgi:heme exporter protein D